MGTYSVRWQETTTHYAFLDADGDAEALEDFWTQHHAGRLGRGEVTSVKVALEDEP